MRNLFTSFLRSLPVLIIILSQPAISQTLNVPPRPANALTGSQFVSTISSATLTNRENAIYDEVVSGNIPDFMRTLKPVTVTKLINGVSYSLVYYVIPDYLAIGTDADYFLCPMTPVLAQRIADATGCILPTRKMVNDIYTAASVKLSPSTITPSSAMTTVPVFNQHNTTVKNQRAQYLTTKPLGHLVGGDKKDVVITNLIYTNTNPLRVAIYGWHQLNGSPIQPLSTIHENTYADYSHGIRLVQMNVTLNGAANTAANILKSSTLNSLLSDEGVISNPRYQLPAFSVATPVSFAVINETSSSLRIKVKDDPAVVSYNIYTSLDGVNFNAPVSLPKSNLVLTGLTENTIYYLKIAAKNSSGTLSSESEVLGAVPSSAWHKVLIVNGFDRASTGNTRNFIRQHGKAFHSNGYAFSSATNEAIINGLVTLGTYTVADYILGDESTANETFSNYEQTLIKKYLNNGGNLFVSGSEVAWDLDYKGTSTDKAFYNQYLKAGYISDAPNNQAGVYYSCTPTTSGILNGSVATSFDNGSQGTINVRYPDVIQALNGAVNSMYYSSLSSSQAGVSFEGMFPEGVKTGRVVTMGVPFETFYPESNRNLMMAKIIKFFLPNSPLIIEQPVVSQEEMPLDKKEDFIPSSIAEIKGKEISMNVYPNPSSVVSNISLTLSSSARIDLKIFDSMGRLVETVVTGEMAEGTHLISVDVSGYKSGVYYYIMKSDDGALSKTMLVSH